MMHYELVGSVGAPFLVLSNSLGTNIDMWEPQIGALSQHFRLVCYDHRGHGGSPVPPGPYDVEKLGNDVLELLDHLRIERTSICGVSLGGMVGLWLGAHARGRIDRLVVCCTAAYLPPADDWARRAATVREAGTTEVIADTVISRWLTSKRRESDEDLVKKLRMMLLTTPADGYANCCEVIEHLDLRRDIGMISAPTLVIAGACDPATPPSHLEIIAAGIRNARLVVLEHAAHLANIERAGAVNELIIEHCRGAPVA
jgi:3-oxoadipate enol-lactonase